MRRFMRPSLGFMREVYAEVYAVAHRCGKILAETFFDRIFFRPKKKSAKNVFDQKFFQPKKCSAEICPQR